MNRFSTPEGWYFSYFSNADNRSIRFGSLPVDNPKANIVFLPGNKEPIEKYFETIADMHARKPDWNIWAMDWMGQGLSDRLIPEEPRKMHCEHYKKDVRDLHQFLCHIQQDNPSPVFLFGHSRGGHLALRYASKHHEDGKANGIITTAPMLDIHLPIPKKQAQAMVQFAMNFGKATDYIPKHSLWSKTFTKDWAKGHSHDVTRFQDYHFALCQNPDLCLNDVTMGWTDATFSSMDWLHKRKRLRRITAPILMVSAGDDPVVKNKAHERAAEHIPNCSHVTLEGAYHDIWMENDPIRNRMFKLSEKFIEKHLPKSDYDRMTPPVMTPPSKPRVA